MGWYQFASFSIVVVIMLCGCSAQLMPTTQIQSSSANTVAPSSIQPTMTAQIQSSPTITLSPGQPTITPVPGQPLTELESIDAEMRAVYNTVDQKCSTAEPPEIGASCTYYLWTKSLSRSEWLELFPKTHFFLIGAREVAIGELSPNSYYQKNFLVIQQDGQRFTPKTYDHLLDANKIEITDENRALVAKAWALMTLPNYLDYEVVFADLQAVEMPNSLHNFNYCLDGWAKLGGLQAKWCFVFGDKQLKIASGPGLQEYQIGEYLEAELPAPEFLDYYFYIE